MATGKPEEKKAAGVLSSWIRYYDDDLNAAMTAYNQLSLQEFAIDFLWAE